MRDHVTDECVDDGCGFLLVRRIAVFDLLLKIELSRAERENYSVDGDDISHDSSLLGGKFNCIAKLRYFVKLYLVFEMMIEYIFYHHFLSFAIMRNAFKLEQ